MRMNDQKLNLKFVQEVEKREVLYNFNLPGYSRKDVVEKAWQEVSDAVNLPVSECREKWRNVRTVFIRKRKPTPNGSRTRRKAYYLADAMQFCLPFIKVLTPPSYIKFNSIIDERNDEHESNDDRNDDISLKSERYYDDEEASMEDITEITHEEDNYESILPECSDLKRIKLNASTPLKEAAIITSTASTSNRCSKIEQKNALKMFLLSLIPEVEDFSDSQIKQFKRKIFSVIDDISGISYNTNEPLNRSKT